MAEHCGVAPPALSSTSARLLRNDNNPSGNAQGFLPSSSDQTEVALPSGPSLSVAGERDANDPQDPHSGISSTMPLCSHRWTPAKTGGRLDSERVANQHTPPPARNVVLEFGDRIGERVIRAARTPGMRPGTSRSELGKMAETEREMTRRLQNPRLVNARAEAFDSGGSIGCPRSKDTVFRGCAVRGPEPFFFSPER